MSAKRGERLDSREEAVCAVCSELIEVYAVGKCDHAVCYKCSTRLRVLCAQMDCPICRADMPKVAFIKKFARFDKLIIHHWLLDRRHKICFEDETVQADFNRLLENRCTTCEDKPSFKTFNLLRTHMSRQHALFYCDICINHLKIFSSERKLYTRPELAQHKRVGDKDDRSHRGHPLCEFCDVRFLDNDELVRHARKEHYYCHFCDTDGIATQFFSGYAFLRDHYKESHYLCEEGACKEVEFTNAFRTEIDLKAHKATEHIKSMKKAEARQARTIDIDINFGPRFPPGRRDRGASSVVEGADYEDVDRDSRRRGGYGRGRGAYGARRQQQQQQREEESVARAIAASLVEVERHGGHISVVDEALVRPGAQSQPEKVERTRTISFEETTEDFPTLDGKIMQKDIEGKEDTGQTDTHTLAKQVAMAQGITLQDGTMVEEDFPVLKGKKGAPTQRQPPPPKMNHTWFLKSQTQDDFPALKGKKRDKGGGPGTPRAPPGLSSRQANTSSLQDFPMLGNSGKQSKAGRHKVDSGEDFPALGKTKMRKAVPNMGSTEEYPALGRPSGTPSGSMTMAYTKEPVNKPSCVPQGSSPNVASNALTVSIEKKQNRNLESATNMKRSPTKDLMSQNCMVGMQKQKVKNKSSESKDWVASNSLSNIGKFLSGSSPQNSACASPVTVSSLVKEEDDFPATEKPQQLKSESCPEKPHASQVTARSVAREEDFPCLRKPQKSKTESSSKSSICDSPVSVRKMIKDEDFPALGKPSRQIGGTATRVMQVKEHKTSRPASNATPAWTDQEISVAKQEALLDRVNKMDHSTMEQPKPTHVFEWDVVTVKKSKSNKGKGVPEGSSKSSKKKKVKNTTEAQKAVEEDFPALGGNSITVAQPKADWAPNLKKNQEEEFVKEDEFVVMKSKKGKKKKGTEDTVVESKSVADSQNSGKKKKKNSKVTEEKSVDGDSGCVIDIVEEIKHEDQTVNAAKVADSDKPEYAPVTSQSEDLSTSVALKIGKHISLEDPAIIDLLEVQMKDVQPALDIDNDVDFPGLLALKDQSNLPTTFMSLNIEDFPGLDSMANVSGSKATGAPPPPGFAKPKPPPGFDGGSTSLPPPGFKAATLPVCDSENIAPVNVINLDKPSYVQPCNFQQRNKKLIEDIQQLTSDDGDGFEKFKKWSCQFRHGEIGACTYYDQCCAAMGTENFQKIFPELLVLLPDINKQQELLQAHKHAHVAQTKRCAKKATKASKSGTWAPVELSFLMCPSCGQVLSAEDYTVHTSTHNLDVDFPVLGAPPESVSRGPSLAPPGINKKSNAWVRAK